MAGKNIIQLLRGTSSQRKNSSTVSLAGQPLWETDTNYFYVGDGSSQIKDLSAIKASEADTLSRAYNSGNITNIAQEKYYLAGTATINSAWQEATALLAIIDANHANTGTYPSIIQLVFRADSTQFLHSCYLIGGSTTFLQKLYLCYSSEYTFPKTAYLYFKSSGTYDEYVIKQLFSAGRNATCTWETPVDGVTDGIDALTEGLYSYCLNDFVAFPTVAGEAISDEDGNNISNTYAKQSGVYNTLGAGYLAKQGNIKNDATYTGWQKIGTIYHADVVTYQDYSCIMVVNGIFRGTLARATAPKSGLIEIEYRKYNDGYGDTRVGVLCGDISPNNLYWVITDSNDMEIWIDVTDSESVNYTFEIISEQLSSVQNCNIFDFDCTTQSATLPTGKAAGYGVCRNMVDDGEL